MVAGERDVLTGIIAHGRPEEADGDQVRGLFLNSLPLRLKLTTGSWLDLARAAMAAEMRSQPFARYPLAAISRDLGAGRLFECAFNLTHFHVHRGASQAAPGFEQHDGRELEENSFTLQVTFNIDPNSTRLLIVFLYHVAEVAPFQMAAIGRLLQQILAAIAFDANGNHDEESLLSAAQHQQLVYEWNDTALQALPEPAATAPAGPREAPGAARGAAAELYLHQVIARQVVRAPDALAAVCGDDHLTYAGLAAAARRLARRLHRAGVGPEATVGICAERSTALLVGLLAILEAGSAYLPLDPDYPPHRLAVMAADAGLAALLVDRRGAALPELAPGTPRIPLAPLGEDRGAGAETVRTWGENAAYVIYTSGSTGHPKGVVNTHAGIVNRLLWMQRRYRLGAEDRVLQKTPISFDVSVWELFWPLLSGAALVFARPGGHRDTAYLTALIAEARVTTVHFVPSLLAAFLEEPDLARCAALRTVIASGEALSGELAARFRLRLGDAVELHSLYGPTEAAVDVTAWHCRGGESAAGVPIGRPIDNLYLRVLDATGRMALPGAPGELHIGGRGLARGYLGRPDLTADRFVPDLAGEADARLYRTGDLARLQPDGCVEFLGRADDQVKLRGVRIELGEIEAALADHPAVHRAAVALRQDLPGGARLVAYLTRRPAGGSAAAVSAPPPAASPTAGDRPPPASSATAGAADAASLAAFLRSRLPEAMLPSLFVELAALPLTPSGKLDRRALPPPQARPAPAAGTAELTNRQQAMARMWAELLGLARIGLDDDFFELGGHSILAVRATARMQRIFKVPLPLRTLYEARTVRAYDAALAGAFKAQRAATEPRVVVEFAAAGTAMPLLLVAPMGCTLPPNAQRFADLAARVAADRPVYGVQPPRLMEDEESAGQIATRAASCIDAIRALPLAGRPVAVAAWSSGGPFALELAQQLAAAGTEVTRLVMLDVVAPLPIGAPPAPPAAADEIMLLAHCFCFDLCAGRLPHQRDELAAMLREVESHARLPFAVDLAKRSGALDGDTEIEAVQFFFGEFRSNLLTVERVARDYRAATTSVPLTLLRTQGREGAAAADPTLGWGRLSSRRVEVHVVPGNHESFLAPPHVDMLATRLVQALASGPRRRGPADLVRGLTRGFWRLVWRARGTGDRR